MLSVNKKVPQTLLIGLLTAPTALTAKIMQNHHNQLPNNESQYPIHFQQPKPDLLLLKGTLCVVVFLTVMGVIINFIPTLKPTEVATEEAPQPIIVNVPEQSSQPDNYLGLTLEEYNNLSDPSEEILNCLLYEGGKGCFSNEYTPNGTLREQPNLPQSESSMFPKLPNVRSTAVAVASGRELPYWKPNYNLRPMPPGVCPPSLVIAYQNQRFCGRRPIFEASQTVRRLW